MTEASTTSLSSTISPNIPAQPQLQSFPLSQQPHMTLSLSHLWPETMLHQMNNFISIHNPSGNLINTAEPAPYQNITAS